MRSHVVAMAGAGERREEEEGAEKVVERGKAKAPLSDRREDSMGGGDSSDDDDDDEEEEEEEHSSDHNVDQYSSPRPPLSFSFLLFLSFYR